MNLTETISELLSKTAGPITIGRTPHGSIFVQQEQLVRTGEAGNQQKIMHQIEASNLADCITRLREQTAHSKELQVEQPSNLIAVPRNNSV